MRVLILSDLHANLQATDAVLADARRDGWDRALVLGDLVGYGADPIAVIDTVRALGALVIRGNHDKVAAGIDDASTFNVVAKQAAEWTAATLDADRAAYLRALPQGPLAVEGLPGSAVICHGAPFDEDYYVFDADDAARALAASTADVVFFGHTHVQIGFREVRRGARSMVTPLDDDTIDLAQAARTMVNPGSVGQPRDGDPRAAYALLDTATNILQLRRVVYDISEAQRRIRAAGLHPHLAERLSVGR
ncbi:MAG: metallophosphatase family protein [Acidobacteriota bacterium]|nr:metallophosphatase family protein [Acidobacteriota bacterium]